MLYDYIMYKYKNKHKPNKLFKWNKKWDKDKWEAFAEGSVFINGKPDETYTNVTTRGMVNEIYVTLFCKED